MFACFTRSLLVSAAVLAADSASRGQFPAVLRAPELNGRNGFTLYGVQEADIVGHEIAGAGDVNHDGYDDLLVGMRVSWDALPPYWWCPPGTVYVLFGKPGLGRGGVLYTSSDDTTAGFFIEGLVQCDYLSAGLAGLGDFNGDGVDDIAIGAIKADVPAVGRTLAGVGYFIFGHEGIGESGRFDLATLNGSNGFVLWGAATGDLTGWSVASAGDFNNDGHPDLVLGAHGADPYGMGAAGRAYIIYGGPGVGSSGVIDLATLDASQGLVINGTASPNWTGFDVAYAGQVNGDDVDDIIISAQHASPGGRYRAGQAYVVFGGVSKGRATLDLWDLDGTNGFTLNGVLAGDESGWQVGGASDLNGDSFADVLVGSNEIPTGYVSFGGTKVGSGGQVELSDLDGTTGFAVTSQSIYQTVAGGFDLNTDGVQDCVLGDQLASFGGGRGSAHILLGGDLPGWAVFDLTLLNGRNGFRFDGPPFDESMTGGALAACGDLNGDGLDDLAIGAAWATPPQTRVERAGAVYVIFGRRLGDFDLDADVDLADFLIFQQCFAGSDNPPGVGCPTDVVSDLDYDGDVDLADFLIFQQNFTGSR